MVSKQGPVAAQGIQVLAGGLASVHAASPWAQPFVVLELMVITSRAVPFHLICCFMI